MQLHIIVKLDGAAFHDDDETTADSRELARVLAHIAADLPSAVRAGSSGSAYDSNGNRCARWVVGADSAKCADAMSYFITRE